MYKSSKYFVKIIVTINTPFVFLYPYSVDSAPSLIFLVEGVVAAEPVALVEPVVSVVLEGVVVPGA